MQKYDLAVVGAGLGGLVAAALLSGKKKRILVLSPGDLLCAATGMVNKDGFIFYTTRAQSLGFEQGGVLAHVCLELGMHLDMKENSPSYQVALPDHRITVYPEIAATLEELDREFPDEITTIKNFYRDMHTAAARCNRNKVTAYLSRRRSAASVFRRYGFSRPASAYFTVQSLCFFQRPAEELSLAELITLCTVAPRRNYHASRILAEELSHVILRHGGQIIPVQDRGELARKGNRVIGIKCGQDVYGADTILLNEGQRQNAATLFIGLPQESIPVRMCQEVICLPDYERPREFFTISLSAAADGAAPAGMNALRASFQPQEPAMDARQLLDRVGGIMPFLVDTLVLNEMQNVPEKIIESFGDKSWKPLRSIDGKDLLSRGSPRNVYWLAQVPDAPLQTIAAARQFAKRME